MMFPRVRRALDAVPEMTHQVANTSAEVRDAAAVGLIAFGVISIVAVAALIIAVAAMQRAN